MNSYLHLFASLLVWTSSVDGVRCPTDWISPPDDVSCYKLVDILMNWYDARDYCQSLGGHLLTLDSIKQIKWITSMMKTRPISRYSWMGLYRSENGTLSWADGSSPDDHILVHKVNNQEHPKSTLDCALYIRYSHEIEDGDCTLYEVNSVCEKEIGSGSACPKLWLKRPDSSSCYFLKSHNHFKWKEAREHCQTEGGDLVQITSKEEKEWLSGAMETYRLVKIWIGLSNKEEVWRWTDGTNLDTGILSWRKGSPRERSTKDEYFLYISADGKLSSTSYQHEFSSICQISRAPYTIACEAPPVSEHQEVLCFNPNGRNVQCHHNLHVPLSAAAYKCKEPYQSTTGFPYAFSYCKSDQKWEAVPAFQCH